MKIWQLSATELSRRFADRDLSPVEVLEACLARMVSVNPVINALVTFDEEAARCAAADSERRWREGKSLSPLDGVPITVKDNIPVRGMRTTWGSLLYADYIPDRDELPVARLRTAGAVIVGKTNVPEFTLLGYTDNLLFGPSRNPWDTRLTPGGSSGGAAAAVAAGIGPVAIGTDGGGSIRRPAAHTGVVGFKPSVGRVPRCDGFPAILFNFEVIGPIARSVDDAILIMRAIAPSDPRDPLSAPYRDRPFAVPAQARRCRMLYIPTFGGAPVDPQIAASVAAAARRFSALGHEVDEADGFALADPINRLAWPVVSQAGLAWLLEQHPDLEGKLSAPLAAMSATARQLSAGDYLGALMAVGEMRRELAMLFQAYDVLLTPSTAALPWPAAEVFPPTIAGQVVGPRGHAVFTGFANAAGLPALNLPAGPSTAGLPIGFQLVGRPGEDDLICAIARDFERAHPWTNRWPVVFGISPT